MVANLALRMSIVYRAMAQINCGLIEPVSM